MRFLLVCIALVAMLPNVARASTLWQVWRAARANDPAFLAAGAKLRATATDRPAALAALLPHVALAAGAGPQNQYAAGPEFYGTGFEPITEFQRIGVSTWQATLTQTLFDWGSVKSYQAAGFRVQAAAATYQATLEALTVKVATDYVAVLAANADLAALRGAERGFGKQYHDAEARYRAGMAGVIGADEARAALESLRAQVVQAQTTLIAARETLAALTGNPAIDANGSLPEALPLPKLGGIGAWIDRARSGNPTLAAANLTARGDAELVSAAQGSYLPNVSLQLQHTHIAQGGHAAYAFLGQSITGPGNLLQQGNSVTVQLNWHVFSGGATVAATDRARALRDEAHDNAATAQLTVIRTIRTDYFALTLDRSRLDAARSAALVAAKAVRAASDGARAGLISESDLIADRQQLLSADLALHAAIVSAIGHELGLAQAEGSATPALVHSLSTTIAPTHNPKEAKP